MEKWDFQADFHRKGKGRCKMAEKDIMEKILLSYADVFEDCGNVRM